MHEAGQCRLHYAACSHSSRLPTAVTVWIEITRLQPELVLPQRSQHEVQVTGVLLHSNVKRLRVRSPATMNAAGSGCSTSSAAQQQTLIPSRGTGCKVRQHRLAFSETCQRLCRSSHRGTCQTVKGCEVSELRFMSAVSRGISAITSVAVIQTGSKILEESSSNTRR